MSFHRLDKVRNIGIISHIDAGKTTVSERMLYYTGELHRMGEVHDGSATMDWMDQERQRGITITASATSCRWGEFWINLIDTPGHIDFTIEVERSLRVLDGAVAIFSAVEGVQPQSESVWRQADRYRVPRICLINKLDRIGADYQAVLEQMRQRLAANPVLLQLPTGLEADFTGVVDLVEQRLLRFDEADQGQTVIVEDIPAELEEDVAVAREALLEAIADEDDDLLAALLEGEEITPEQIRRAVRKGVLGCRLSPILLGSALRNRGIQPLLDAVGAYLPSPADVTPPQAHPLHKPDEMAEVPCDAAAPFCALAFKVMADEGRKLTYLRIYAGTLRPGDTVFNSTQDCQEKVARLFRMHSHKRERLDIAGAGEIVAAAGLKEALTGDTLATVDQPLVLSGLDIPEPVVSIAVEPKGLEDRDKLSVVLEKLQWEDPTFRVHEDAETGQTILSGMGELHLEVLIKRLADDFGVAVQVGRPQVVYREAIRNTVQHREIFQREAEGKVQHGEISLTLRPTGRSSGVLVDVPEQESLPEEWREAVTSSLTQAAKAGPASGFPLCDLAIEVTEIPVVQGETTETGLMAAAQRGVAMAVRKAGSVLYEPVMELEILAPGENTGKVLSGLQQKRGQVTGMRSLSGAEVVDARVPLSEMFGYMTELRSATQGRGTFTMEFSHFEPAPAEVQTRYGLG